jgi:hypothetical protein
MEKHKIDNVDFNNHIFKRQVYQIYDRGVNNTVVNKRTICFNILNSTFVPQTVPPDSQNKQLSKCS